MQILRELSSHVQVPEEHQKEERVFPQALRSSGDEDALPPLIRISSDTVKPGDAFALVQYNDRWF